jgi:polyhydroxybutyrate depolymerase
MHLRLARLIWTAAVVAVAGVAAGTALTAAQRPAPSELEQPLPQGDPIEPAVTPNGRTLTGALRTPDGTRRTYRLYVPSGLPEGTAVPLMIALHGGLGSGRQFEQNSGFDGLAQANGFLVVYPDGTAIGRRAKHRVWNAGGCCGVAQESRRDVDDVKFVSLLIDRLKATHHIDRKRVYVAGHSNGAMLAFRVACELSGKVVAIGVQAGTLLSEPCRPPHPVSVLEIHGTADENVPIDGGSGSKGLSGVEFPAPRAALEMLAAANRCPSQPTSSPDGQNRDVSYLVWRPCLRGSAVVWVRVANANHAWMGHPPSSPGAGPLLGMPYMGFDASAAIWSFLSAHPRT